MMPGVTNDGRGEQSVTHVHGGGTHGGADHAVHGAHQRRDLAISLLGASALARLAIAGAVSALLWLAILWALA
jgi:hypothetical protein